MRKILGVLVVMGLMGCAILPTPVDPAVLVDKCERACAKLAVLQCNRWQGSPGEDEEYGTPDDDLCVNACMLVAGNQEVDWQLECVVAAGDCDDYEACYK